MAIIYKINDERVEIPTSPKEVTLKTYCELELMLSKTPQWFQDAELSNLNSLETANFYLYICEALAIVTGKSVELFQSCSMTESGSNSLIIMYSNIPSLLLAYKPKEIKEFKHRGKVYQVPHKVLNAITGRLELPQLTTIEGVLLLQYNHIYSKKEAVNQLGVYHKILLIISVLCRLKNEALPMNDKEISDLTAKRKKLFEDIKMDVALDIYFFLSHTYESYRKGIIQGMPLKRFIKESVLEYRMIM